MKYSRGLLPLLMIALFVACSGGQTEAQMAEGEIAQTPDAETVAVDAVGQEITLTEAISVDSLLANPAAYVGQVVLVEGTVAGRCAGTGCWISFTRGDQEPFYARSADHSFIFPADCVGKTVAVQGTFTLANPEAVEHEHAAEGEEVKDHVCPNPEYYLEPLGAKVKS